MDNTELHYITYDPDAIWERMMMNYVKAGGDILYPGDEKEMLLRSVQADIVQVLAAVDNAMRMQTLRYAVGDYLDIRGEERGCIRIAASKATAKVTIVTNATGRTDTLSAGTAITADGEMFYLLTEDFHLTGYQQTVVANVIADRAGSAGNGLIAGTQMALAVSNAGIHNIVALTNAAGGNDAEDDETYRSRTHEHGLTSVNTGPKRQYEAAAKAVSSEILDAKALNLGAGNVGIYLVLASETGATAIMQSVLDALSAEEYRPLTDNVTVHRAAEMPYTLNVRYISDDTGATNAAIAKAARDYQGWQDDTIGRAFNPDRLMSDIYKAGATRVWWGEGSNFNGGNVEYTEIGASERCKGTISLAAGS